MKKFKSVLHQTPQQTGSLMNRNAMHQLLMNGPTLSPQGQVPSSETNSHRPPGLASPPRPAAHANGYNSQVPSLDGSPYTNGYSALNRTPTMPPVGNFQYGPNPFHNTFNNHRPSSSSSLKPTPSPVKARFSLPAEQGTTDVNHHLPRTPAASFEQPSQKTPQARSPSGSLFQASSPHMAPPTPDPRAPRSGLSPLKNNSPPRPPSSSSFMGTPAVPPAARLSPPPQLQNLHVPVKSMTPEQSRVLPPEMFVGNIKSAREVVEEVTESNGP